MKYTAKLPTEKQLVKRGTLRTKECPRLYRFVTQHPCFMRGIIAILYAVLFTLYIGIPVTSKIQLRSAMEKLPKDSPAYFMAVMCLRNSDLIGIDYDSIQSEHFVICMLENNRSPCIGILAEGEYRFPEKIYDGVQNPQYELFPKLYANSTTDNYLAIVIPDLFANTKEVFDPLRILIMDEDGKPYQVFTSTLSTHSVFYAEYDRAPFGKKLYAVQTETGETIEIGSLSDQYPLT